MFIVTSFLPVSYMLNFLSSIKPLNHNKLIIFLNHVFRQVCFVEFDRKDINMNKLVATVLESKIHVFDMRTQHPKKGFAKMTEKVTNVLFC